MGFFDAVQVPSASLEPLSLERLRSALTRLEVRTEEEHGGLAVHFETGYFFFSLLGEEQNLLAVRGTWRGSAPIEEQNLVSNFCETWNREMLFPKAYPAVFGEEQGQFLALFTDSATPMSAGATDDQLDEFLSMSISTGLNFFEAANQSLRGEK